MSFTFCILQTFNWEPLCVLNKFKRIKKNMNSWESIIKEKTGIETNNGKILYLKNTNVSNMQCLNFKNYYIPGRLSTDDYLPEFIRRGNSGPWLIKKNNIDDEASLQFCEYLIQTKIKKENFIKCGIDMFNKIGFSGYFTDNFICEETMQKLN